MTAKRPGYVTPERWVRGEVDLDEHADPDRPLRGPDGVQTGYHAVRGARAAQGGHDYLHRRGSLDDVQWAVARVYADAWHGMERSGCALAGLGDVRVPVHQQGHPAPAMVASAGRVREAQAALGQAARLLVHAVTVQGLTLGVIGGAAGETDQVTLGRLRAALDRLAEVWMVEQ